MGVWLKLACAPPRCLRIHPHRCTSATATELPPTAARARCVDVSNLSRWVGANTPQSLDPYPLLVVARSAQRG